MLAILAKNILFLPFIMSFIPFALPDIGQEEIERVVNCMQSGWLTTGPATKEFEQNFSTYLGTDPQTVSVNSATSGLLLAMEALGIGAGDEVITTPYTFSSTAMMVVQLGAKPVFVDVDPVTLNIDVTKIEAAITERTKAILPVHFAGLSCDLQVIRAIADRHGLKVIDDAAHALPTRYRGQLIGATPYVDATVFSFYATKTITTGEGGMIATASKEVAERCRIMRLHGISRDAFDRYISPEVKWYYEIVAAGYKCNLTDIASSIGIEQLKKSDRFQQRREEISNIYRAAFKDLPVILPATAPEGDMHAWHLFTLRLRDDAPLSRDEFIARMHKEFQIGCSVHFIPLHLHPFWRDSFHLKADDYPCAVDAYQRVVSLPIYTKMSSKEVDAVVAATQKLLS